VSLAGPPALLSANSSLALALVLHELGTNTRKYGALSVSEGKVSVTWSVKNSEDGPVLHLIWAEQDGPTPQPSEKGGIWHDAYQAQPRRYRRRDRIAIS
jgi:two-component sensor histidine kinase